MNPPQSSPSLSSHLVTLLMPFTMVVLIPWWLLAGYPHPGLFAGLEIAGGLVFALGFGLFAITVTLFVRHGRGTLAPWRPTQKLIIIGPYRHCRNPMISGVLGMILGEALFFGSSALLLWALSFFAVNTIYFMLYEEPDLGRKHGAAYARYRREVPRWLPRLNPYRSR